MSQGKRIDIKAPADSIEQSIIDDDYPAARKAMAIHLARMFSGTDSARDAKALALSLAPLIDRCEHDFAKTKDSDEDTPLAEILTMAANA